MKLSFLSPPDQKPSPAPKILTYLDKRVLIAIVYGLFVVLQTLSLWRQNANSTNIFINILLFSSGFYYYYQRRHQLKFPSHPTSQLFGGLLVGLAMIKLFTLHQGELAIFYWAISTPIIIIGISLLAGGFWGIKQFSRLIIAVFLYSILMLIEIDLIAKNTQWLVDFSATVTSYFLWYLGFTPEVQGNLLVVNDGIVKVNNPCTLIPLIFVCFSLVLVVFPFFPFKRKRQTLIIVLLLSASLSFVLSIVRIAVMALVVNDKPRFDYWHGTSGSNIFMIICLVGCGSYIINQIQIDDLPSASPRQQPLNYLPKAEWLTKFCLLSITAVLSLLIFSPDGGAKKLQGFSFPGDLPLSAGVILESQALSMDDDGSSVASYGENAVVPVLSKGKEEVEEVNNRLFGSGRRYWLRQGDAEVALTLSYVLDNSWQFLRIGLPSSPPLSHEDYLETLDREDPKAPFLIWQGEDSTHLLSCLTARGQSLVTDSALSNSPQRIRETFRNPSTFYEWISGQRMIKDSRCIWVHLSEESIDDPETNQRLIGLWQELQGYWAQSFPSL